MNTVKQNALAAVKGLSDSSTLEDAMYRLYVLDKIERGQSAILQNKTLTIEELRKQVNQW